MDPHYFIVVLFFIFYMHILNYHIQAEKFRMIYDDEWTPAFETLEKQKLSNEKILDCLAEVVKVRWQK